MYIYIYVNYSCMYITTTSNVLFAPQTIAVGVHWVITHDAG